MRLAAYLALALLASSLLACAGTAPLPPRAIQLNASGAEALAAGDLATADARFSLALEYHPRFVEALANLGLVEMQRGNLDRARLLLERARRINPDLAQPHHGLGVLEERVRRPDQAAEHYRDALRINPGFTPSRANLARLLFAASLLDEAREQFKKLLESDPTSREARVGLAETLLRLGRATESDTVVDRAKEDLGEWPDLTLLIARRHLREGAHPEAEAILVPLTTSGDDVARAAWSWLATSRLETGDEDGALAAAERAFELDRDDPVATFVTAMALRAKRDPRALTWLERAHRLAPRDAVLEAELRNARSERR